MLISYTAANNIALKSKTTNASVGSKVIIGTYEVPGAGEYDVAGMQCEAKYLDRGLVYFFRTEDLVITYLTIADPSVTKVEDASDTQILIIDLRSDDTAAIVKAIVKSLEPAYLFLLGNGVTEKIIEELNLPCEKTGTLKVNGGSLPEEGTTIIQPI